MRFKSVYGSKWFRSAAGFLLLGAMLLPAVSVSRAEADEVEANGDLTQACKVALPERSVSFEPRLTDARYNSRISFEPDESLALKLGEGARGLYVAWYAPPEAALVEMLDATGNALSSLAASTDLYNEYFALPKDCASVRISGLKPFAISELRVFDSETAPDTLCVMQAQKAQPKVMLMAAYPSDESMYFSSLLPYLSGDDAALVFLSSNNRQAIQEAITARYALGSRTQPIFGSFPYYPTGLDLKRLYTYIEKKDVNNWLIQVIRRYQPDTLITPAAEPEDGIGMHQLVSTHALIAVEQAADDSKEYVSERAYGVWQVRAVYQHLSQGANALYDTQAALPAFGGESAISLAQAAYECYSALRVTHQAVIDAPYFVQAYPQSAVSGEQSASDLLSILQSLKSPAAAPAAATTPAPSDTPEPEATPEPAKEQAQANAQTSMPAPVEKPIYLRYLGGGVALVGLVLLVGSLIAGKRSGGGSRLLQVAGVILALVLVVGGGYMQYRELTMAQTAQAPAPTPEATPEEPMPEPTEEPSASEPEATRKDAQKAEFASHFRKDTDPAEVVVFDEENGVYEYRNDVLAIEIRRFEQTDPMLAYYIAHIYMREIDSYRSGFGSVRINGRDTQDACEMARQYRAVLGMTGDNLLHSDYNRGMMLRDGRIFRSMTQVSLMALTEDLSMRIYNKQDASMLNEIEEGTQDTFAFGPPLIMNGVLCEGVDQDRVGRINPRAGLGLVEPGHYVAIVADGRLPHYSHGMMLSDFAKLFQQEGCVMAYNLDGGASATLVFMGEYINKRAENHYRSVPDQLLWGYSEQVPSVNDPYRLQGLVPQGWSKGE